MRRRDRTPLISRLSPQQYQDRQQPHENAMKICIVGPSGCGKDEAAEYLRDSFGIPYWGPMSRVIAPYAAKALGVPEGYAYACRHTHRGLFRRLGDELRRDDPAALARYTLARGDIAVGVRSLGEIRAVRKERLADVIIWVARDVPPDETLEFDETEADLIVHNYLGLPEFYANLATLARLLGLGIPSVNAEAIRRKVAEVSSAEFADRWWVSPCEALGLLCPAEVYQRGEVDRLWRTVVAMGSGMPI